MEMYHKYNVRACYIDHEQTIHKETMILFSSTRFVLTIPSTRNIGLCGAEIWGKVIKYSRVLISL